MGKKIHRIDEITKRIVSKHLREAIDYDPSHRERMERSIEGSLAADTHPFGGSPFISWYWLRTKIYRKTCK